MVYHRPPPVRIPPCSDARQLNAGGTINGYTNQNSNWDGLLCCCCWTAGAIEIHRVGSMLRNVCRLLTPFIMEHTQGENRWKQLKFTTGRTDQNSGFLCRCRPPSAFACCKQCNFSGTL